MLDQAEWSIPADGAGSVAQSSCEGVSRVVISLRGGGMTR